MASYTELYIDKGTDFNSTIVLQDDNTNLYQNVDGYVITSSLRRSPLSPNASANLVCTVSDAANGEITLFMDSANTANLKAGRYFFDVKARSTMANTRLLEGVIIVTPSIT